MQTTKRNSTSHQLPESPMPSDPQQRVAPRAASASDVALEWRWILTGALAVSLYLAAGSEPAHAATNEQTVVGFGKVDITPDEPVRLSGYASREASSEGIADRLAARAMVISPAASAQAESVVLISIDSIVITSPMSVEIAGWLYEQYRIPRSQVAICSTHSHTAPHVAQGLENIFTKESTPEQQEATERYTQQVRQGIQQAIEQAMQARRPASLEIGEGSADFAVNRRLLKDGQWSGFGEQPGGAVDHRVRVLVAIDAEERTLGGAFMYACHCTTPAFNQVSGDWAGLAAARLESLNADAIFLPTIGCGADANPSPRQSYDFAQAHAAQIVDAVQQVLTQPRQQLTAFPETHFGYAGLIPEQPTEEKLEQMSQSQRRNDRVWAEHLRSVRQAMGRLPETYPMPIQTWRFGDALCWVFLGGEVVVDYQFQLEKELPTQETWVAAYANDVFAYVASEAMRAEGGYEVDASMVYYLQPGRWQSGTQSLIARRTREIFQGELTEAEPLAAAEALQTLRVPDGFRVDLVADEQLVQDPINLAFGYDGSVWVVEMADYPLGTAGGGRVKRLVDQDGDGQLDQASLWLNDLSYPSSVTPWRDGVLIISAPDVLFTADRDGDGQAEVRETWLTGIHAANPQHRASGFEWGLDGLLHFAAGDHTHELHSTKNNQTLAVTGQDVAWNPETGELFTTSGATQFVRGRDAFGNWFGNSNSRPMYQYVIEDRYRSGRSVAGGVVHDLLTPAIAPPVYPSSKTIDRFNDLFARDRFTSACSAIMSRSPGLGKGHESMGFICEPVHNLVARIQVESSGSSQTAVRHPQDDKFDFFTSTDPWSRPVRVVNAPDGTIWIVDMVRRVIEHPAWIPTAWQERLDLRAGQHLGRIYRVYHQDWTPRPLAQKQPVVQGLRSPIGPVRELALLRAIGGTSQDSEVVLADLRALAAASAEPAHQVAALGCLSALNELSTSDLLPILQQAAERDPRVVRYAIQLCERLTGNADLHQALTSVVHSHVSPAVDLQWVLTTSIWPQPLESQLYETVASRAQGDPWILRALSLVEGPEQALAIARGMLEMWPPEQEVAPSEFSATASYVARLWKQAEPKQRQAYTHRRLEQLLDARLAKLTTSDLLFLQTVASLPEEAVTEQDMQTRLTALQELLAQRLLDADTENDERRMLLNLIGSSVLPGTDGLQLAASLFESPEQRPVWKTTLEALRRISSPEVAPTVLAAWPQLAADERQVACATLLSNRDWTADLVTALESGQIRTQALDPATVQRLRSYHDRDLRSRCLAVFGQPTPRLAIVARYLSAVKPTKDGGPGEKLFAEHCAACHLPRPGQPVIGPSLDNLQQWTLDQWITAIMDPNQTVEPKYQQQTVLTVDDAVVQGLVTDNSDEQVVLAQPDGTLRTVAREDIQEMRATALSLMPEGFEDKLSPEQLSQLLAYLRKR